MACWIALDSEVAACTACSRCSGSSICVPMGKRSMAMVLPVLVLSAFSERVLTGAMVIMDLAGSSSFATR
ncbi:hypothetical protein D9M70_500720 [compost metagenome]